MKNLLRATPVEAPRDIALDIPSGSGGQVVLTEQPAAFAVSSPARESLESVVRSEQISESSRSKRTSNSQGKTPSVIYSEHFSGLEVRVII